MITPPSSFLEECREAGTPGDVNGAYLLTSPDGLSFLQVIASDGDEWDHVSVSLRGRIPTYAEMRYVKGLFFKPSETVMELHVPESDHINVHPFCLHLWRPQKMAIPRPPAWMVGPPAK